MKKSGFVKTVGEANFCKNIEEAVALAEKFDLEFEEKKNNEK